MHFNDLLTEKIITWGAVLTALTFMWKKIYYFLHFFYRAYKAVEKVEKIEKNLEDIPHAKIADKIDKLINIIDKLRNDVYRLHQVQLLFTNTENYGFFFCDLEGNNQEVNRKYAKMLEAQTEDLKYKGWINFIDNEEYFDIWEKSFDERRNIDTHVVFRTAEDKLIDATVKAYLVNDLNGPCGYAGFIYFSEN